MHRCVKFSVLILIMNNREICLNLVIPSENDTKLTTFIRF